MQRPRERKAIKLTLRGLGLTCYFQEVSRSHSKLGYEPDNPEDSQTDEGPNVRIGNNIKELVEAKNKAETRKRTAYLRIGRKLKVEGERSLATIRRSDVISREMS